MLPREYPLTGLQGRVVAYFQTPVRLGKHWIIMELDKEDIRRQSRRVTRKWLRVG